MCWTNKNMHKYIRNLKQPHLASFRFYAKKATSATNFFVQAPQPETFGENASFQCSRIVYPSRKQTHPCLITGGNVQEWEAQWNLSKMTIHGYFQVSAEATSFQGLHAHWPHAELTACGPF